MINEITFYGLQSLKENIEAQSNLGIKSKFKSQLRLMVLNIRVRKV